MVRAILDGRKTVTRRIVKPQPKTYRDFLGDGIVFGIEDKERPWVLRCLGSSNFADLYCPYGRPGDRLWVRETWGYRGAAWTLGEEHKTVWIEYAADGSQADIQRPKDDESGIPQPRDIRPDEDYVDDYYNGYLTRYWKQNRPSIHMPRWASRITLEVTGVRVERLQDISEADAHAEGIPGDLLHRAQGWSPRAFQLLWELINGAESWNTNPWVWVVEFRRIEQEVRAA
jgi:hypothetical protein